MAVAPSRSGAELVAPQPPAGTRSMPDAVWMLVDHIDRLTDAVYTLAAVEVAVHEHVSPHQAAIQVAAQRHETRHALASWRPFRDSYTAPWIFPGEHYGARATPACTATGLR